MASEEARTPQLREEFPRRGQRAFDVTLDPVGSQTRLATLERLAPRGRIVLYGDIASNLVGERPIPSGSPRAGAGRNSRVGAHGRISPEGPASTRVDVPRLAPRRAAVWIRGSGRTRYGVDE